MAATTRPRESLVRAIRPGIEFRAAEDNQPPKLTGHFSVFDTWTTIRSSWEGTFLERVAPGAFTKTFAERTPKVLLEHGQDPMVGNKPIGIATVLREDSTGAYYEADLFDLPKLIMDGLRALAYDASFRFSVLKEHFVERPKRSEYNPEGLPERTIQEASVAEFGPVTFGAYPDATAAVRSLTDRFLMDALAEDPERLRALIEDRRSRTFTATAPNVRVTYGPKEPVRVEETRLDAEDLDCLGQMLALGAQYIAEQDEPDDAANIPRMEAVLASIAELVPVEVAEDEPADDEENSAAPEGQISEPAPPSEAATPTQDSKEPGLSVATTRTLAATTVDGLYIPNRKETSKWHLT